MLTNDSDPNSDPLTDVLNMNASNGTIVLNTDGSFVYTPTAGFSGPDSFTYHAHDGALDSNVVTVTLNINGATTIAVLANDTNSMPPV